jgi:hypothetical protein
MTEYFINPGLKVAVIRLAVKILEWQLTAAHNKKVKNKSHVATQALLKKR